VILHHKIVLKYIYKCAIKRSDEIVSGIRSDIAVVDEEPIVIKNRLYYLAVPIGAPTAEGVRNNIAAGMEKWKILLKSGFYVCAPHFGLCHILDDISQEDRDLGMRVGKEVMIRTNCIITWSDQAGYLSSGMQSELNTCTELGLPHISLDGLSHEDALIKLHSQHYS
jgi:hypothetical protein